MLLHWRGCATTSRRHISRISLPFHREQRMNRRGFLKTTAASALVSLLPLPTVSRSSAVSNVCISIAPTTADVAADFEGLDWVEIGEIRSAPDF